MNAATNVRLFTTPLYATVDKAPVRLMALGDVEGHSPSYLAVDTQGRSTWVSFDEVRITDTSCLPNIGITTPTNTDARR